MASKVLLAVAAVLFLAINMVASQTCTADRVRIITTTRRPVITTTWRPVITTTRRPVVTTPPVVRTTTNSRNDVAGWESEMLNLVNAERRKNGAGPLCVHPKLAQAAQLHSVDQAQMEKMSHTGSDNSSPSQRVTRAGYKWTSTGENVAMWYPTVAEVHEAWMNSPGHRANILNPSYTMVGFGRAPSGDGTLYWTQKFGASSTERCP